MNYKKSVIMLALTVFLLSMACVCAGDAENASGDATQTEISQTDVTIASDEDALSDNGQVSDASVSVEKSEIDMYVDANDTIQATTTPEGLNITYESSRESVVTVDDGNLQAKGPGSAVITLTVGDDVTYARNSTAVNVTVSKIPTKITASSVTVVYNTKDYLPVTLTDKDGNLIGDCQIAVDFDGNLNYVTNEIGHFSVPTKALSRKTYVTEISFAGNVKYENSTATVKVTVKKATPQLSAVGKIYKSSNKNKKYNVILKDNTGKVLKNRTVTLKLNGKTYKATTNGKGNAVFKLKGLVKNSTATVTYKGDNNFKKVTKKVKLVVKKTFKTISKGSKDKATVKLIQWALKDNGYYLTQNGHYLKVDGIYWVYTVKAVKQFQKANKLKVTGKVNEMTAKKLGII